MMKSFKILPAAAGIIALTATITFAREQQESERDTYFRIRITENDSINNAEDNSENILPMSIYGKYGQTYQVEIARENITRVVSIDAYSGKILSNIEGIVKNT